MDELVAAGRVRKTLKRMADGSSLASYSCAVCHDAFQPTLTLRELVRHEKSKRHQEWAAVPGMQRGRASGHLEGTLGRFRDSAAASSANQTLALTTAVPVRQLPRPQ